MWNRIAARLIRQRLLWLILLGLGTAFMAMQIPNARLQYTFKGLLPKTDSTAIEHQLFVELFGSEGNVLLIGADARDLQNPEHLQAWFELAEGIRSMDVRLDTVDDGMDDKIKIDSLTNF